MNRHRLVLIRAYQARRPKNSIAELARFALCRLKEVRSIRFEQQSEPEVTVTFETPRPEWPNGLDEILASFRLSILDGELEIHCDDHVTSPHHELAGNSATHRDQHAD
jgi:hypothetical protein